jgi:hypothetical protein
VPDGRGRAHRYRDGMAVSANRLELLQIADAVAREKSIDRMIVLAAMEDAIQKAARSRYGRRPTSAPRSTRRPARSSCSACSGGRRGRERRDQITSRTRAPQPGRPGRRLHRRAAAADRFRPHRRPVRQAGHRAEGARGRARPPVRRVQGPHRRDRQRRRQARRIRQRHRRSRPRRGHRPPRRADPARDLPLRRPRPRLCLRRAPRAARPADLPVAHPSAVHGQAVRAGSAGNLRRHHRGEVGRPRPGLARQDRRHLARFLHRSGRRLRRHARLARAGVVNELQGEKIDIIPWSPDARPSSSTRCSRPKSPRSCSTRTPSASRSWCPTTSCRSPSAAAARTCASPRSSPAGTSTS